MCADEKSRKEQNDMGLPDKSEVLKAFLVLAENASDEILRHYLEVETASHKWDGSPVTPADLAANQLLENGLKSRFPNIPVLTEESPDDRSRLTSRCLFVVDPLDGTKEYLARNDEFSVNVALVEDGRPVVGVVRSPVSGDTYAAIRGVGAWQIVKSKGAEADDFVPIHVSSRTDQLILAVSRSHPSVQTQQLKVHPKVAATSVCGSSLKGCLIACGKADVYYRFGRTMEWDTAAMECIVEAAGGIVRQMDGTPVPYNKPVPENANGFFILNDPKNALIP